jgi:hypothetical protein
VSGESLGAIPDGLDSGMVARLTERLESENFIFHYQPGDTVWVDRQEALHRWAVDYLGISLAKKIDYYKFDGFRDMTAAHGMRAAGRAFPRQYALATAYHWQSHEAMHIYTYWLCQNSTIRLYDEGMAVAHEIDPLNDNWVAHWNRADVDEHIYPYVYAEKVREHRAAGRLYPIEWILESRSFDAAREKVMGTGYGRVLYDQAGIFVSYLIDTYGIDKMKQAICSVTQGDTRDTILRRFEEVFGVSVQDAERRWWAHLDSWW